MKKSLLALIMMMLSLRAFAQMGSDTALEEDRYRRQQARIFGELGVDNYSLEGTGTSVSLSNSKYSNYGLAYKWYSKASWGVTGEYSHTETTVSPPTGLTPSNPMMLEDSYSATFVVRPFLDGAGPMQGIELGIGYYIANRRADMTYPSILLSDQDKQGPQFSAQYTAKLNDSFSYQFRGQLQLVNYFKETAATTTGSYSRGYRGDLSYMLLYPIASMVDLSFGLHVYTISNEFYGTGVRGLSDAIESSTGYGIPLEVVVFF